jgi:hypothetical protein
MEELITVRAKLVGKETASPVSADGTFVKVFDKDVFEDDFLGQAHIDENGQADITFPASAFKSLDSPAEKNPDLYFTVHKYGKLLYKSKVITDLDLDKVHLMEPGKGKIIDLGVFAI